MSENVNIKILFHKTKHFGAYGFAGAWNYKLNENGLLIYYHYGFFPGYTSVACVIPKANVGILVEVDQHNSVIPEMIVDFFCRFSNRRESIIKSVKKYQIVEKIKKNGLEKNSPKEKEIYKSMPEGVFFNNFIQKCKIYKVQNKYFIDLLKSSFEINWSKNCVPYFVLEHFSKPYYLHIISESKFEMCAVFGGEKYIFYRQ